MTVSMTKPPKCAKDYMKDGDISRLFEEDNGIWKYLKGQEVDFSKYHFMAIMVASTAALVSSLLFFFLTFNDAHCCLPSYSSRRVSPYVLYHKQHCLQAGTVESPPLRHSLPTCRPCYEVPCTPRPQVSPTCQPEYPQCQQGYAAYQQKCAPYQEECAPYQQECAPYQQECEQQCQPVCPPPSRPHIHLERDYDGTCRVVDPSRYKDAC